MKKIILASTLLIIIFVGSTMLNTSTEGSSNDNNDQSVSENVSSSNQKTHENKNEPINCTKYSDPVLKYLKSIKSGNSDDLYFDKLENIRDILTTDLYDSLMPKISDEAKESIRSEKKELDDSYSSKTSNYEISYSFTNSDEQDVFVIYSYQSFTGNGINESRYLFHAKVKKYDANYLITSIVEDSQLIEGLYSKVK